MGPATASPLYILHLKTVILKLQRFLNSGEISDTTKARLEKALAETETESRSSSTDKAA
jgi:hypothetical protein